MLVLLDGDSNQLRRDGHALGNGQTQRLLHRVLAVPGRQLQDLQVFADALAGTVIAAKPIVGNAKVAARKHLLPILVVLERTGLANQRIDHVTVIDRVLAAARQPGHPLNFASRVPDLDEVRVDHDVDPVANQPAGNRIRVTLDLDRAATVDLDPPDTLPVIQLGRRQLTKERLLLRQLGRSRRIALVAQPLQELLVLLPAGEVAAAA
ncbi:MAG TPA: hypothetical protein VJL29_00295 [Thermoguttaceae bacterium]|nr:hypothetical protein [Thermoguttaceae bacterium]